MLAPATFSVRGNFTFAEFLAWSGVGRTFAYSQIKMGKLIAVKAGHRTLIPIEAAEAWRAALPRLPTHPRT